MYIQFLSSNYHFSSIYLEVKAQPNINYHFLSILFYCFLYLIRAGNSQLDMKIMNTHHSYLMIDEF
jgi:hypothetical protein